MKKNDIESLFKHGVSALDVDEDKEMTEKEYENLLEFKCVGQGGVVKIDKSKM